MAICACLRRVMSREMPNVPMTFPSLSRRGILVVEHPALAAIDPGFFFLLAHERLARLASPAVRPRYAGRACSSVKKSKSVLPRASAGSLRPNRAGQGLVDAGKAALRVLEVNAVGDVVHERVQQVAFLHQFVPPPACARRFPGPAARWPAPARGHAVQRPRCVRPRAAPAFR